jgi:trimeric autotransporter adhesin
MMAALGPCGALTASTVIMINELTTVAAVWPLAPFMSSYSSVGSGTSDATNLAAAFALAANYANISTGTIPGLNVPAGATVPVTQINTLADILSTCVDSTGGVAGDGSVCGTLFSAATPTGGTAPVNVISAGLAIANNPTANIPALFGLVSAATPYQPTLSTAPADLAVGLSTTAAGLSVSPIALAFPAAYLGISSAPQSVWITNTSALPITLDGDNFLGANPGDFRVGNYDCPATLGVGGSCTEQIIFMPSVAGERTASWTISDSGPVNPSLGVPSQSGPTVTLTGIGIAGTGGPLTLSPSSLTFTEVGIPQTVIVTNNGTVPVMLGAITSSIGGLMSTTCGTTLDAQSICTISVQIPNLGAAYSAVISVPNSSVTGTLSLPITVPESNAYIFNSSPLQFGDWALGLTSPFYPELLYPYPPPRTGALSASSDLQPIDHGAECS